jgi:deoxyribodipyrimidine photo-lyase
MKTETRGPASIVWFRQDLRLADNPALLAAVARRGPVIPVYVWAAEEEGRWRLGAASKWWLHQSLAALDASLRRRGSRLVLRGGPTLTALSELAKATGASAVFWNRRYEPAAIQRDGKIEEALRAAGLVAESFNGDLLFEPGTVTTRQGRPYQVFTPFWRACLLQPAPAEPEGEPGHLEKPRRWPTSLKLADLQLEPRIDWASGLRASWQPGEAGARAQFQRFLAEAVQAYATDRNRPDHVGSSRLSPHLHFGEVSIRAVWQDLHALPTSKRTGATAESIRVFANELGWREFARHLLFHFPHTAEQPLRPAFNKFPWRSDSAQLRAWQRGRTGYPIVDAGMRELWHTGWMHNRVRMIVASFLVKDLLISWHEGAAWFWDTLVDADLANNTLGWQWSAGCGADAAPYFRIFNPLSQGERFDPSGDYVRLWVPELRSSLTTNAGAYPRPIIDHTEARTRALAAFRQLAE